MTPELIMRRLSLIKQLYLLGLEQSKLPEIISYSSVLLFHDAIDLFVQLAAQKESVGIVKDKVFLMEYFTKLPKLTMGASVKKINDHRNALKHQGIIPSSLEIAECTGIASVFFAENTSSIFEIDFDKVSLLELIVNTDVKLHLQEALAFKANENWEKCAESVAKAFFLLTYVPDNDYNDESLGYYYHSHIKSDHEYRELSPTFNHINISNAKKAAESFDRHMKDMIDNFNENYSNISSSLMIVSLGIDYRKFIKFSRMTPEIKFAYGEKGKNLVAYNNPMSDRLTQETCEFLVNFVIDCSIRLQRFNFPK